MRTFSLTLHVWRQKSAKQAGQFAKYQAKNVSEHMSFLEMLDVVNQDLLARGDDPIAFDHDCREGICGMCGFMVNGDAHGGHRGTTICQLHMRHFKDGEELWLEPWRSSAFPIVKDLAVDRGAFDRVIASGGFVSVPTGSTVDGNAILIPKTEADLAMDAAACIGCGACVAMCPNSSAALFTAAKVGHLGLLPQGQPERHRRVLSMVGQATAEGFGHCSSVGECEAVCPKEIPIAFIARMNRDYLEASVKERPQANRGGSG
jgi:succinate dehydrogenase iron-sulfur subunit